MKQVLRPALTAVVSAIFGITASTLWWSARAAADTPTYRVVNADAAGKTTTTFEALLNKEASQGYRLDTIVSFAGWVVFRRQ